MIQREKKTQLITNHLFGSNCQPIDKTFLLYAVFFLNFNYQSRPEGIHQHILCNTTGDLTNAENVLKMKCDDDENDVQKETEKRKKKFR